MTVKNSTSATARVFTVRYRTGNNGPDSWHYMDLNQHRRSSDQPRAEVFWINSFREHPVTLEPRDAAHAVTYWKAIHPDYIWAVHKLDVTDPEDVALIEARNNWKAREQARFDDGTYTRTIFEGLPWYDELQARNMFIHNSVGKAGFISFTSDTDNGARDRQTRMAASRFLSNYYRPDTRGRDVEEERQALLTRWNDHHGLLPGLRFTKDPDEIERVYRTGPGACMSHSKDHYSTEDAQGTRHHPTAVYGNSPDLELAYLVEPNPDTDSERIVARALVWPDRTIYGRTYGDTYALEAVLQAKGWRRQPLVGARIRNIPLHYGNFVMPYIDDTCHAQTCCDQWHKIANDGEGDIYAGNTCGSSNPAHRASCDNCGDSYDEDDLRHVEDAGMYCDYCCDTETLYCDHSGERYTAHNHVELHSGRVVHEDEAGECEHSARMYHTDELVTTFHGTTVHENYVTTCEYSEEVHLSDDCVTLSDGRTVFYGYEDELEAEIDAAAETDDQPAQLSLAV